MILLMRQTLKMFKSTWTSAETLKAPIISEKRPENKTTELLQKGQLSLLLEIIRLSLVLPNLQTISMSRQLATHAIDIISMQKKSSSRMSILLFFSCSLHTIKEMSSLQTSNGETLISQTEISQTNRDPGQKISLTVELKLKS